MQVAVKDGLVTTKLNLDSKEEHAALTAVIARMFRKNEELRTMVALWLVKEGYLWGDNVIENIHGQNADNEEEEGGGACAR